MATHGYFSKLWLVKNVESTIFRDGALSAPLREKLSRRKSVGEDIGEAGWGGTGRMRKEERPSGLENIVGKIVILTLYRRKLVGKI